MLHGSPNDETLVLPAREILLMAVTSSSPRAFATILTMLRAPTLVISVVLFSILVAIVARQAPADSAGVRWQTTRKFREIAIEPLEPTTLPQFPTGTPSGNEWLRWFAASLALLLLLVLLRTGLRQLTSNRQRSQALNITTADDTILSTTEADARVLATGLAAAIDVLGAERDVGNAVVKAWQGLEDAAATAGISRQPAETASEFTARILYRSQRSAAPIAVMLTLYQRVRFGEITPHADDIATAQDALATLKSLWDSDLPERRHQRRTRI